MISKAIGSKFVQRTISFVRSADKTISRQTKPIDSIPSEGLRMASNLACDTVTLTSKSTFSDVYDIIRLGNGKIKLVPKIQQVNNQNILPVEIPEYLYHVTSETSMKLIRDSNAIKVSANEQLPGVFLLDKENFLTKYISVGKNKLNLCKSIIKHADKTNDAENLSNLVVIRIPTESLVKCGKLRVRTQEDFFHYQDKIVELQQGLKHKFSLRELANDKNREQFKKHVLDNKLMSQAELDKFMKEMEQKIHRGYSLNHLEQLEKNCAVEYIFNNNISPEIVQGIKSKRFSVKDCINQQTGELNIEYLKKLLK